MFDKTLYMPSTPLNLLVSVAHALQFKQQQSAQLWMIDQKNDSSPYIDALKKWQDSPFDEVAVFCQSDNHENKYNFRKQLFKQLNSALMHFRPNRIAVGSDRRVEFQYVMYSLSALYGRESVKGLYFDDGLYSYAGRPYKWYKDQINSILKKIAYGFWWREPATVGASSWVDETWLFQPQKALPAITEGRKVFTLKQDWFVGKALKQYSSRVLDTFNFKAEILSEMDVLLFIPHPNNVAKMQGYEHGLKQLITTLCAQEKKVAIKYHPRVEEEDYFGLKALGVALIVPSQLASEFILPALKRKCLIVGDVGTALLTAKWIRPELQVYSLLSEEDPFQQKFVGLMQTMNINVIKSISEIL